MKIFIHSMPCCRKFYKTKNFTRAKKIYNEMKKQGEAIIGIVLNKMPEYIFKKMKRKKQ